MRRDPALIPLSHQHQHALALCVRIERAFKSDKVDLVHWQEEIARLFAGEIRYHFESEEKVLFPVAARQPALSSLVDDLLAEHKALRKYAHNAAAGKLTAKDMRAFATALSGHVRKEERVLFEKLQEVLPPVELRRLGDALDHYFRTSGMPGASCALPPEG
jgi:hemerythrin-like domain-containing protein